ncbi:MAG: UDP-N-acetylglucosamine 2-epimerase [candidate division TM6 bacterium GW2011_GWF2_28_16]|nr:MAG: UDP-N-acetylglucosamine 2-epimerase [candidate division TM6 bacterium GW2011_GWF2_28_16]
MHKPILLVIGTRAEAIKLIPLYLAFKKENINVLLCATFQHSDLLQQVFDIFKITPDFNLDVMIKDQDLFYLQKTIMERVREVYHKVNPILVLVHGDTTTTMSAALAAFYLNIPVGHVEAGLRTGNMRSPFPEELNRKLVTQIADLHFAPTAFSTANLLAEGVARTKVFCTGNTVVDVLLYMKDLILNNKIDIDLKIKNIIEKAKSENKKIVLLTAHRRESFGPGLVRIFNSIKKFANLHKDVLIILPAHPNPNVLVAINNSGIKNTKNIIITESLLYKDLIYLLINSNFVATDSGGIQEEAVSLGKHVIVLRDVTERWEGVWDGSEDLVGTNENLILSSLEKCYHLKKETEKMSSIYGDGKSCNRIVSIIRKNLNI